MHTSSFFFSKEKLSPAQGRPDVTLELRVDLGINHCMLACAEKSALGLLSPCARRFLSLILDQHPTDPNISG